jgi:hypothetical protein
VTFHLIRRNADIEVVTDFFYFITDYWQEALLLTQNLYFSGGEPARTKNVKFFGISAIFLVQRPTAFRPYLTVGLGVF